MRHWNGRSGIQCQSRVIGRAHTATGASTLALTTLSAFALTVIDDADGAAVRATLGSTTVGDALFITANAGAARSTLGLGTFAVENVAAVPSLTMADSTTVAFNTGTGTKLGGATGQKISLWNKTPIVQPTTGISAGAFVANTSLTADDSATYGGYTIGQIAAALINFGLLA